MTNYYFEKYFTDEDELVFYIMTEVEPKGRTYNVKDIRIDGEITGYKIQVMA